MKLQHKFLLPLGLCNILGCTHAPISSFNCTDLQCSQSSQCHYQNAGKPDSAQHVKVAGRDAIRFEIRHGEAFETPENRTYRSEVKTNYFPPMGSERWYRFSILLPGDFPIEKNRLVLAQWWAKTKRHLGEVDRSPILHLRFSEGQLLILLRRYPDRITLKDEKYLQTNLFETHSLPLGTWNDFVFHIKWSADDAGFIDAWWNQKNIISFRGKTENQDEVGPVFKFGLYRDDSEKTYVSYVSDAAISEESF